MLYGGIRRCIRHGICGAADSNNKKISYLKYTKYRYSSGKSQHREKRKGSYLLIGFICKEEIVPAKEHTQYITKPFRLDVHGTGKASIQSDGCKVWHEMSVSRSREARI